MAINTENFDEVLFVNASIGSDDYNGTIDNPYKTIATAVSNATGNNVLINIGKGIYEVNSIIDMSKTNKILTFVGKSKDTTLIIKNVYTAGSFHGDLNIYNLIFKPADNFSGDTRVLSYSIDSREVNYYNCVFTRSSNGQFPTNGLMYTSGSGSANMNKNLYNCSIKGITPICGSGGLKVVNCCTDSITLEGNLTIVDCLAGVTYDNKYKTRNNNYGVYSGENRWSFIKALISDNGILKTFDPLTNSIINFDGDISEMNNNNSTCTFIDNINDILPLINLKQPGVKLIFNKNTKSSVASLKTTKQLFLANGDFSTRVANNIDYFKFNYDIPDGTTIKTVVSINSGAAWYSHIDGAWTQLDNIIPIKNYSELSSEEKTQWNTFLDEVLTKGINIQDINTLDFNTLNSEKIRFAYAIQISDANANAEAILKDLKWQFDSIGSYEQLNPKTDVNIKITNNDISITPLKNIELMKINVGISSQVPQVFDTSGLLDKETFKGKEINSVKLADKAKSLEIPKSQFNGTRMYYGVDNNDPELKLRNFPAGTHSDHIDTYTFDNLTKGVPQTIQFVKEIPEVNVIPISMKYVEGLTNQEYIFEKYSNDNISIKKESVQNDNDGLSIKDNYKVKSALVSDYYESDEINKSDFIEFYGLEVL